MFTARDLELLLLRGMLMSAKKETKKSEAIAPKL